MNFEAHAYTEIKKYLESLGFPATSIFPEYDIRGSKIDAVVKSEDDVLIAIEIKGGNAVKSIVTSEIGYHPMTRNLQKIALELKAKYYLLSDGERHIWLKTGPTGRPEQTIAIAYSQLNANTISEAEFTKALLEHAAAYIRNFPITGDHLYDVSVVLYAKLLQDTHVKTHFDLRDIIGSRHIDDKSPSSYSPEEILTEILERLKDIDLIDNRIAVFEFIDAFFEAARKEWNVPRWMADFMVSLIDKDKQSHISDLFSRNGILTSAAYLKGFEHVRSYYAAHQDLYWIKVQQILGGGKEAEVKFEPGLLNGEFSFARVGNEDAILLAPPFNMKFHSDYNSDLRQKGIKDGNALFLEAAIRMVNKQGQVVAIVPDGFLLSAQHIKSRSHFMPMVEAVISLPVGAFKPYSGVKTSLLVLEKDRSRRRDEVFMAFVSEVPYANPLYNEYDATITRILKNLSAFRLDKAIHTSKAGFIVKKLSADNFHVSKYWLDERNQSTDIPFGFVTLPLKEVVNTIFRGSPIVRDPDGDIPYINPAVVRTLRLNHDALSYTKENKLSGRKVKIVAENDVLVNIIGHYRGNAALVSAAYEGMAVNHHIAILKPNTDLIHPGYLAVVLNSQVVQDQLHDQTSGTVISALNLSSFERIVLPIPDLETQGQIYREYAKRLDELAGIKDRTAELEGEISQKLSTLGKGGDKL